MSQPHGVCAMPALQDRMGVQVAYALEKTARCCINGVKSGGVIVCQTHSMFAIQQNRIGKCA